MLPALPRHAPEQVSLLLPLCILRGALPDERFKEDPGKAVEQTLRTLSLHHQLR